MHKENNLTVYDVQQTTHVDYCHTVSQRNYVLGQDCFMEIAMLWLVFLLVFLEEIRQIEYYKMMSYFHRSSKILAIQNRKSLSFFNEFHDGKFPFLYVQLTLVLLLAFPDNKFINLTKKFMIVMELILVINSHNR